MKKGQLRFETLSQKNKFENKQQKFTFYLKKKQTKIFQKFKNLNLIQSNPGCHLKPFLIRLFISKAEFERELELFCCNAVVVKLSPPRIFLLLIFIGDDDVLEVMNGVAVFELKLKNKFVL